MTTSISFYLCIFVDCIFDKIIIIKNKNMIKKIALLAAIVLMPFTGFAQITLDSKGVDPFEKGKLYLGASMTGLELNYTGSTEMNFGVGAQLGYTIADNFLVFGTAEYMHYGLKSIPDQFSIGAGGRYYIVQNGLFLGANCKYVHANKSYNDIMPGVEIGYAYFISRTVTIEPSVYYQQSFKNHSDFSSVGLKIGLGIYLE